METQDIRIPKIDLEWSDWYDWSALLVSGHSGGISIPNKKPGVYEAKLKSTDERLAIGKASDLRMRVRQGLVKGKTPHSSGARIRANEDTSMIEMRWAQTDHPAAVEEELHRQYIGRSMGVCRNIPTARGE